MLRATGHARMVNVMVPFFLGTVTAWAHAHAFQAHIARQVKGNLTGNARLEFLRNSGPAPEMREH